MLFSCYIKFFPLFVILLASSSQAIFFHLAKHGILDLFKLFHEKKELKKSIPNIHHYHVHYYPLYVQPHHSFHSTIHAPSKYELDKIHINQLESVGWSNNKLNHVPEPSIYQAPVKQTWSSFFTYSNPHWDSLSVSNLDRRSGSEYESGLLIRVPKSRQTTAQSPSSKERENANPFMTFLEKMGVLQSSDPESTTKTSYEDEKTNEKMSAYYTYVAPEKS